MVCWYNFNWSTIVFAYYLKTLSSNYSMVTFSSKKDLASFTTFWLHAYTDFFVEVTSEKEVFALLQTLQRKKFPHFFLGNGANVLFTKDYEWLVVKIGIKGRRIVEKKDWIITLAVGAGEDWNDFVLRTINQWWAGLENLVAIPSSVWAAAFGNIWAYGMEAKDRIVSVRGIDLSTWKNKSLTNTECMFWYRESIFKRELNGSFLITEVIFALEEITPSYHINTNYRDIQQWIEKSREDITIKNISQAIIAIRNNKLPDWHKLWTAGSFFKNPLILKEKYTLLKERFVNLMYFDIPDDLSYVKLSAGQLIELAGFKWYRQGNVGVYQNHALILVNYGWGTGEEVKALATAIQEKVYLLFGVQLEPEVIYV